MEVDRVIDQVERHFMDTFGLRLQEKDDRRVVFMLVFVSNGALYYEYDVLTCLFDISEQVEKVVVNTSSTMSWTC